MAAPQPVFATPSLCAALNAGEVRGAASEQTAPNVWTRAVCRPLTSCTLSWPAAVLALVLMITRMAPACCLQVVDSDVGPTIPGISPANLPQFLLDLVRAVAAGALQPGKLAVAVTAAGVEASDEVAAVIADVLW